MKLKHYLITFILLILLLCTTSCTSCGGCSDLNEGNDEKVQLMRTVYNNMNTVFDEYKEILSTEMIFTGYNYATFADLTEEGKNYYINSYGSNILAFIYGESYKGYLNLVIQYATEEDAQRAYNTYMYKDNSYFVYKNLLLFNVYPSYLLIDNEIVFEGNFALTKDKSVLLYNRVDEILYIPETVKKIAGGAFYKNENIKELYCNQNLESISTLAFSRCTKLNKIVFSDNIKNIDSYAFYRCTSLVDIELPKNLEYLGEYAFVQCTSLKKVKINDKCKYIESGAFQDCPNIAYIVVPHSVEYVGSKAFQNYNIFLEVDEYPLEWDFVKSAKTYLSDEWEYNLEGIPVLTKNK